MKPYSSTGPFEVGGGEEMDVTVVPVHERPIPPPGGYGALTPDQQPPYVWKISNIRGRHNQDPAAAQDTMRLGEECQWILHVLDHLIAVNRVRGA